MWTGIIEKYRAYLPVSEQTPIVSLCEGNTPLIPIDNLLKRWAYPHVGMSNTKV